MLFRFRELLLIDVCEDVAEYLSRQILHNK
ncbi:MAG: hypothetical protein CLLPBCKN_004366 [Chroococcidiopsis cubana SAG 39.79]|nr:hypothetical protein [Chroococcidiopsis cubana SAG 39.79]